MEFANYQLDWPRENLSVRCFVHDVFNYRYHWHEDEYELNILLHGLPSAACWPTSPTTTLKN